MYISLRVKLRIHLMTSKNIRILKDWNIAHISFMISKHDPSLPYPIHHYLIHQHISFPFPPLRHFFLPIPSLPNNPPFSVVSPTPFPHHPPPVVSPKKSSPLLPLPYPWRSRSYTSLRLSQPPTSLGVTSRGHKHAVVGYGLKDYLVLLTGWRLTFSAIMLLATMLGSVYWHGVIIHIFLRGN